MFTGSFSPECLHFVASFMMHTFGIFANAHPYLATPGSNFPDSVAEFDAHSFDSTAEFCAQGFDFGASFYVSCGDFVLHALKRLVRSAP